MLPQEIIAHKRDGLELSSEEIDAFVSGISTGRVTQAQVAAFAMAVFFRGMAMDERIALTRAMTRSGVVLSWADLALPGPILDKHSTGGIGDTVSLLLAPMVAACGGYVPMISGRGLGHTGGTLDKLEAIPGYVATPDRSLFRRVVAEVGCAIIGQTADLAPADKVIYGVRDVTATVESIPLITASILSKKLAAGLDALVMDVKTGSGAFMTKAEDSLDLARSIATVATGAGLPTVALVTAMDQPLCPAAGNAVEVLWAIEHLTGRHRDSRLHEVTVALSAEMIVLGGLARDTAEARVKLLAALDSGVAAERFQRMVSALGGPSDLVDNPRRHLAQAPLMRAVPAPHGGVVAAIDTRGLGLAVVALGGGRTRAEDSVDHSVGLVDIAPLGGRVEAGTPLAIVHARDEASLADAYERVAHAYEIAETAGPIGDLVQARVAGRGKP